MTGMRAPRLWALGGAAFLAGAIGFFPASLIEDRLNQALPPPWRIAVTGTIWAGAGVVQGAGPGDGALTVPLTFAFDPLALARLRLAWKVVADSPSLSGSVRAGAGWQSWEFRDAALTMDAAMLPRLFPALSAYAPAGTLHLATPAGGRLTAGHGDGLHLKGDAQIGVERLALAPFGNVPLGNYQLRLSARGTAIDYAIAQSEGALKLDGGGSIRFAPSRQFTYAGHVTPSAALPEAVLTSLKAVAKPAPDGRLRIAWTSAW